MEILLSHFTEKEIVFDSDKVYPLRRPIDPAEFALKPCGLWLSDETDHGWKKWCEGEEWRTETLTFQKDFLCDVSKWVVLRDMGSVLEFHKKYSISPFGKSYALDLYIDWDRIRKEFSGILITPYQWELRLSAECHWYYGWDCASACVWDLSTVKEVVNERKRENQQMGVRLGIRI